MMLRTDAIARRGQAMVEFALIIPIFLLFVFGILDLGRAVYAYSHPEQRGARGRSRGRRWTKPLTRIQDRRSQRMPWASVWTRRT